MRQDYEEDLEVGEQLHQEEQEEVMEVNNNSR